MQVKLVEVGPRDGLQNERRAIALTNKIALVDALSQTGLRQIECASFVSPKWVPQMTQSADVLRGITRQSGVAYTALVPNLRGLSEAQAAGEDGVAIFAAASEGFSQANINASIEDSLTRYAQVIKAAKTPVRGYLSCVIACPFDSATPPIRVAELAARLIDMGCAEVSLGDTIGAATPDSTSRLLDAVLTRVAPAQLAGHFHDTHGAALANIDVALDTGLRVFDTAVGGLGGCPYAPGAPGNVATEAVLAHLAARGIETGLDAARVADAATMARALRRVDDV